jgi:catechol 2,3-dioxygenase-like lactoylglutathione lyase family enzyme
MSRLGPIACVTIAAPEVQRMIDTYRLYLGYELVDHGKLSAQQAQLWGRPGLAGRRYAIMLPGGEGETSFRFVESPQSPAYKPFVHLGWNAAELMVQDTDAAAARLVDSPFRVIGPPANLSFTDKIRAMQVLGPSSESLYLTSFKEKMAEFDVPDARHFIDRVFIVILGGRTAEELNDFYTRHFGAAKAQVMPAVISVVSSAHGLPADTRHDLAAIALSGQSYIEADTMPASTLPRTAAAGELPPAIAMVSFGVDALPDSLEYLAPPQALPHAPYRGRRAAVAVGAAGELIELIER